MKKNFVTLKNFYFGLILLTITFIIITPVLIKEGFSTLDEEASELILIAVQFIVAFILYRLYQREIEKSNQELIRALQYIGTTNVEIQNFKEIFIDLDRYPRNEKEFKFILNNLTEKAAGIAKTQWILLRIVNTLEAKTLTENLYCEDENKNKKIGNKELISGTVAGDISVIGSRQDSFNVKAFCAFSAEINKNQRNLIQRIVEELEIIYLLFSITSGENSWK
jgi:hypothetical protein